MNLSTALRKVKVNPRPVRHQAYANEKKLMHRNLSEDVKTNSALTKEQDRFEISPKP